ncbi:MAG: ABC transporter ATP-binding protein [Bdellovibrionales bacterium]
MLVTRLHRDKDYGPWLLNKLPHELPSTAWRMVKHVVKIYRWRVTFMMFLSILLAILHSSLPFGLGLLVDTTLESHTMKAGDRWLHVLPAVQFFIGLVLTRMALEYVAWICTNTVLRPLLGRQTLEVFGYTLRHPVGYYDNQLAGRIIQKSSDLVQSISKVIETWLWDYCAGLFSFITALVYFTYIMPALGAAMFVWLVIYGYLAYRVALTTIPFIHRHNDLKSVVTGRYADLISNIRNMFLFGHIHRELSNLATIISDRTNAHRQLQAALINIRIINQVMAFLAWMILLGGGLYGLFNGMITPGDFALIGAQALLLVTQARTLADKAPDTIEYFGAAQESLNTLVHPTPRREQKVPFDLKEPSIHFDGISFGYAPDTKLFDDLSLHINPGERVGLVGPSGSGKSTLMALLLRLYEIQGGAIRIGGEDISKMHIESVRSHIGFIPQDTSLFHRTIIENIRYSRPGATDEEVIEAAKAAQAHDFIMKMKKGYNTMVGERGVKLSGGQRQRIAIARALVKNAPILLLDEATSALDSVSEQHIRDAISTAMHGRTVIAIAHRLSTLADLDRIIVLKDGVIVEMGAHRELLEKNGLYAKLWEHQSGGFISKQVVT